MALPSLILDVYMVFLFLIQTNFWKYNKNYIYSLSKIPPYFNIKILKL